MTSALDFLHHWAPEGPWVLNAIDPERKKGLVAQTFGPDTADEATAFIDHWNGKRNLYFLVNVPREPLSTKAKKEHIGWFAALHVDVDPGDPPKGADVETIRVHYEAEHAKILERLQRYNPAPSVIIFSGGGYQGFWLLREPIEIEDNDWTRFEAYNRRLEIELGGDHCWNIDRIMRLPGTINVPDAKKIAKGRTAALAHVVSSDWSNVYELDAFLPLDEEDKKTSVPKKQKRFKSADWLQRLIENGPDHEGERSYGGDRSKAVWAVLCAMVRANWSAEDMVATVTDKKNKISDHVYDQSNALKYAERQVAKAREYAGADFTFNEKGAPHPTQENVRTALKKLEVYVKYDEFARRVMMEGPEGLPLRRIEDRELNGVYLMIAHEFGFRPAVELFRMMIVDECYKNTFHPLKTYLDSLKWDGIPRIDEWLIKYGGAKNTAFVRAVSSIVLLAAVRRVRQPGCKYDEIVVLESDQGFEKSTALAILAKRPEWFTDSMPLNAKDKELLEALEGKWIVESPELKGMRRSDVEHHKAMLSRQFDRARLSYGHFSSELPRQCVFFGTTNADSYLRDTTGNRRFWPIKVGVMDSEGLRSIVDQLWAEAVMRESDGESIRLPVELYAEATLEQQRREIEDPWTSAIEKVINGYDSGKILSADIWNLIEVPMERRTQEQNARIGEVMRSLGWERKKLFFNGKVSWSYAKGTPGNKGLPRITIDRDSNGQLHTDREGDESGHSFNMDDDIPFSN